MRAFLSAVALVTAWMNQAGVARPMSAEPPHDVFDVQGRYIGSVPTARSMMQLHLMSAD